MIVDALILAGGRSSRLDGTAKSALRIDGESLLRRTLRVVAAAGARTSVVVGDEAPDDATAVREDPPFGGPVAAIAAGLETLPGDADAILVLACDMPDIALALSPLFAAHNPGLDGVIAVDRGRPQPLAILVRSASLATGLSALPATAGAAMRALLDGLDLHPVDVPDGSTDDIDTWADADRFGALAPLVSGGTS